MTAAYYNEIDPYAAQWLRNLIAAGHISPGDVDDRSIEDVTPDDLKPYTQCHFFAGIGVWSHALRLAGWEDDRHVWTGSCPCQPFSAAGKGAGFADERHLWPSWLHLISERRPTVLFGEQVAGPNGLGWLDLVHSDLEGLGYACGAAVAPAAGFGAPHIRERLYWVAYTNNAGPQGRTGTIVQERSRQRTSGTCGAQSGVGDAKSDGRERRPDDGDEGRRERTPGQASATDGFWRNADWLYCRDDKWRPVEPGTFPLAHGVANRVGKLRAYGNAIVAPQAQAFIEAAMEYRP